MSHHQDVILSTNERHFIIESLRHSIRVDGRSPIDLRDVKINLNTSTSSSHPSSSNIKTESSSTSASSMSSSSSSSSSSSTVGATVQVSFGHTRVAASLTCDISQPDANRPNEGKFNLTVNLSPLASIQFTESTTSTSKLHHSQVGQLSSQLHSSLNRILIQSRCIDTESLCILSGEQCWNLNLSIHILDSNGNLLDVAQLAALTALMSFRRPHVTVVGRSVTIHSLNDAQPVQLSIHHEPVTVTFSFFKSSKSSSTTTSDDESSNLSLLFVIDPTSDEESVSCSRLSLTYNQFGQLMNQELNGGQSISLTQLLQCHELAAQKSIEINSFLHQRLAQSTINQFTSDDYVAQQLNSTANNTSTSLEHQNRMIANINSSFQTLKADPNLSDEIEIVKSDGVESSLQMANQESKNNKEIMKSQMKLESDSNSDSDSDSDSDIEIVDKQSNNNSNSTLTSTSNKKLTKSQKKRKSKTQKRLQKSNANSKQQNNNKRKNKSNAMQIDDDNDEAADQAEFNAIAHQLANKAKR